MPSFAAATLEERQTLSGGGSLTATGQRVVDHRENGCGEVPTRCIIEWAAELDASPETLRDRIENGHQRLTRRR